LQVYAGRTHWDTWRAAPGGRFRVARDLRLHGVDLPSEQLHLPIQPLRVSRLRGGGRRRVAGGRRPVPGEAAAAEAAEAAHAAVLHHRQRALREGAHVLQRARPRAAAGVVVGAAAAANLREERRAQLLAEDQLAPQPLQLLRLHPSTTSTTSRELNQGLGWTTSACEQERLTSLTSLIDAAVYTQGTTDGSADGSLLVTR
jgi:hypothetical protein